METSNETPEINCCICYLDTRSYVILECSHKIGIVCFLTMIKNRQYRCPMCRATFAEIEDSDDDEITIDQRIDSLESEFEYHDDRVDVIKERIDRLEERKDIMDKIMKNNRTVQIMTGVFFILSLVINRF